MTLRGAAATVGMPDEGSPTGAPSYGGRGRRDDVVRDLRDHADPTSAGRTGDQARVTSPRLHGAPGPARFTAHRDPGTETATDTSGRALRDA